MPTARSRNPGESSSTADRLCRVSYLYAKRPNDLLAAGFAADSDVVSRNAAAAVGEAVAALGAAGARTVLVPNLPNIGITPALQAVGR